jgi:hypothetical protein
MQSNPRLPRPWWVDRGDHFTHELMTGKNTRRVPFKGRSIDSRDFQSDPPHFSPLDSSRELWPLGDDRGTSHPVCVSHGAIPSHPVPTA